MEKTDDDDDLNEAERAFLDAVFACKGVRGKPSLTQFNDGLSELSAYAMQVQDNPPDETGPSMITARWLSSLSDEERIMLVAAAWMRFRVTKPSIFQLRSAHRELFGIDLCGDLASGQSA